jgi:hypothetical protein
MSSQKKARRLIVLPKNNGGLMPAEMVHDLCLSFQIERVLAGNKSFQFFQEQEATIAFSPLRKRLAKVDLQLMLRYYFIFYYRIKLFSK